MTKRKRETTAERIRQKGSELCERQSFDPSLPVSPRSILQFMSLDPSSIFLPLDKVLQMQYKQINLLSQ